MVFWLNTTFWATWETILQTNFWTWSMRAICTSIDNCIFISFDTFNNYTKVYNTLWVLIKQQLSLNTQYKIFTIKDYIIIQSRRSNDRYFSIYKNWALLIDTSYYLVWWPDLVSYFSLNQNKDIIYFWFYNTQYFYFDTTTEMTWVITQTLTPSYNISANNINKIQIIWWRWYYLSDTTPRRLNYYENNGNYLAFSWFDYNITDFSVLFIWDKYYYSFITTDTNPYNSYIFSYAIDNNNFVTFDWYKFIHTWFMNDGFANLFYATYWQSSINLWFAPLFIPWWLDLTLKYFVSYVNVDNNLVSSNLEIARSQDTINTDTKLTETNVTDDLLNIDLDWDGNISIVEATLAPFTILKNIIVKLYKMFENIWTFLKAILNIWHVWAIFFETTYAYTWDDVLLKILDKTDSFYTNWATNANNIHSFLIFTKFWGFFLIFFCILLLFFILYLKNK